MKFRLTCVELLLGLEWHLENVGYERVLGRKTQRICF